MNWHRAIEVPWIVFIVYWAISALKTQPTAKQESSASRYGVVLLTVVGAVLVFSPAANAGVFGEWVFKPTAELADSGIPITWAGIALAVWARWHLGQYWSGRVTIKEDHKLIRTGPYSRLRHPIYTGLDLAFIGTAMTIDRWRAVVGVCLVIAGFWIKARREEQMLRAEFGEAFLAHQRDAGFLLPKWR
jgi:protein-S-isoprenylcysteine O-methyltransferase Ste14